MDKPKTNYLNLSLIFFAFILFSVGVYFLGRQSIKVVQTPPIPVLPQTTVIPALTPADPTANWKTYVHPDNLYSIKYPSSSYIIREDKTNEKMATVCKSELVLVNIKNKSLTTNYENGNIILDVCMNPKQFDFPNTIFSNINGTQSETVIDSQKAYVINGVASLPKLGIVSKEITRVAIYNQGQYSFDFVGGEQNMVDYELFTQILSTFKFTESKTENKFKLGNSNFYLNFPGNSVINKNNVTINNTIFNINTFVGGGGLCPMDQTEAEIESCTYTDQSGSKWGTYRVWTKFSKPFAINPQSINLNSKYFDGMVITKSKPNEFFTQAELLTWNDILNKISYSEE